MTTTIDATPSTELVVYVIGNDIQALIDSMDLDMAQLQERREGYYIKIDKAFDVLLDVRSKLKGLIEIE
jgi:hypothetical protein